MGELSVEGPNVDDPAELFLSHAAGPTEEIWVEMEKAQVSQATVADLNLDLRASQGFGPITYATAGSEHEVVSKRTCTTFMGVKLKDNKQPDAIHFSQGTDPRDLKMKIVGAELGINMSMTPESADNTEGPDRDNGPGCWKHLVIEPWVDEYIFGLRTVEGVIAPNSEIQFRFTPAANDPSWEVAFESLKAHVVRIKSSKGDSSYEIRAVDEANLLRIDSLAVDSKQLRISVSGEEAFVTANGKDGVGYFERIDRHWARALVLAIATIALFLWLAVLVKRLFRSGRLGFGLR